MHDFNAFTTIILLTSHSDTYLPSCFFLVSLDLHNILVVSHNLSSGVLFLRNFSVVFLIVVSLFIIFMG